jgi:hypothetical protein
MLKGKKDKIKVVNKSGGPLGWVFFTAWVGALFYFEGIAYGFWPSVLAFLKACIWPAYVLHAVLKVLNIS